MTKFCIDCGSTLLDNIKYCNKCGTKVSGIVGGNAGPDLLAGKRERVLGPTHQNKKYNILKSLLFAVPVILGIFILSKYLQDNLNPILAQQPTITNEVSYTNAIQNMKPVKIEIKNGKISIPLDEVINKKFVKFNYKIGQRNVPVTAFISGEGKLITAISVCEPCNSTSFHIKNDKLICNSCGTTWELNSLNGVSGSCQKFPPDPIPSTIVGNRILIDESHIKNWTPRI